MAKKREDQKMGDHDAGRFVNLVVRTHMFHEGRIVTATFPLRSLPYTDENRDKLFAERDLLLGKKQRALVMYTLHPLRFDEPLAENRRVRRRRQGVFARLMRRFARRTPKAQLAVDEEVERIMAEKETGSGLVLPDGSRARRR